MSKVYFGFNSVSRPGEHIFLSYNRMDVDRVKGLALELHNMGFPIWYDDGLIPGKKWENEILENVVQSRLVIFLLTETLFKREKSYMYDEFQYAFDYKKYILCVWIDDIGNMDCNSMTKDMYLWWRKIKQFHNIEVFYLSSDTEKAKEIYRGICRADSYFCLNQKAPTQKSAVQFIPNTLIIPSQTITPRFNVHVGGKLQFGQYPQGINGEIQPLVWRVLNVENGRALLITEKLVDSVLYNKKEMNVTWETCTLRKWLNRDFFTMAFDSFQQTQIAMISNQNYTSRFSFNGVVGGNATLDKVFILNIDEVAEYYHNNDARMAVVTPYAYKRGSRISKDISNFFGERTGWWWLRSPGANNALALIVCDDGRFHDHGTNVNRSGGSVRPALWLNLS